MGEANCYAGTPNLADFDVLSLLTILFSAVASFAKGTILPILDGILNIGSVLTSCADPISELLLDERFLAVLLGLVLWAAIALITLGFVFYAFVIHMIVIELMTMSAIIWGGIGSFLLGGLYGQIGRECEKI